MAVIYGGYVSQPQKWSANVKLGGVNTPPVEFVLDETLPVLGQDDQIPNRDWVVIPAGRFVAAKATDLTRLYGETVLTLANGVDPIDPPSFATGNVPFGYAPFNLYRSWSGLPADRPLGVKHETIELPYTSINESYNNLLDSATRLKVGEWVMPYYGSTSAKTAIVPKHKGKPVRFLERKVYLETESSATGQVSLSKATLPAFKPKILAAYTAAGAVDLTGSTLNYDEALDTWVAIFGQSVKYVIYEVGAHSTQRIGQIIGIEPVGTAGSINATSHDLNGWLKWVTDNYGTWDWPLIMNQRNYTSVTNEAVSATNNVGTLARTPVVPFRTITVTLTGTVTSDDGTVTTYTGATMAQLDTQFFSDFTQGREYDIDMLTGVITFASNVSVTAVTVSYSYEADFDEGLKWDTGILGLTDGSGGSGLVGLPAHLDITGVYGAMRIMVL